MKKIFFALPVSCCLSTGFSQNVGIGTTAPGFKLDVKSGSINTDSFYRINTYPVISIKGTGNYFAGKNAGSNNNTGSFNTATGDVALFSNTSGIDNTALGSNALYSNTTGLQNTSIGSFALNANTTGSGNAATGYASLLRNTTGRENAGYGYQSLVANITGSYNTAIGINAGVSSGNLSYATAVGYQSKVNCSNCLVLGGTLTSRVNVGINNSTPLTDLHIIQHTDAGGDKVRGIRLQRSVNTNHWRTMIDPSNNYIFEYNDALYSYIEPVGGTFVNSSDARLKKDIIPLDNVLYKLMALVPKAYHYSVNKNTDPLLYGFIAQDVQKIFPEFVKEREDGYLGIAYSNFGVIAIKAIQEQQQEIDQSKRLNELQQKQIDELKRQIELLIKNK
ncbi:MAG: tail fiber domain-containing protein [Ferruginibacter sp.]